MKHVSQEVTDEMTSSLAVRRENSMFWIVESHHGISVADVISGISWSGWWWYEDGHMLYGLENISRSLAVYESIDQSK
jgi:hypothetical protein